MNADKILLLGLINEVLGTDLDTKAADKVMADLKETTNWGCGQVFWFVISNKLARKTSQVFVSVY